LRAVTRGSVLKALGGVAFAALLVCALVALSGTAVALQEGAGAGAGEPPAATDLPPAAGVPDAAAPVPPPAAAPEGGSRRDRRQQLRRLRRFGQPPQTPDAGAPPDAGARDAASARHDAAAVRPDAAPPLRFAMRDGGVRPFAPPRPPPVAAAPPPPPPPPQPTGPSTSLPVTELGFNTCQKVPAGKRAVKMNLKPEVELPELVAWISSITCKSFVLPGHLSAGGKKLTFVTQGTMTPTEAYAAFLTALDSVGLTVERGPGYNKIIETTKAKMGSTPVYGFDGKVTQTPPKRTKSSATGN
jgi:hypothetical protein